MTPTSSGPGPSRRARLLASLITTLVALLALEVWFRVQAHRRNQEDIRFALEVDHQVAEGEPAKWVNVMRRVPDEGIVYGLKPGLDALPVDMGGVVVPVSSNSRGFRAPELPETKPPDTIRIVGIGDSVMFGYAVREEETYLALLEDALNERHPERRWEVLNTAVPGYNTRQELEVLRAWGLAYEPDLVILGLVANDYSPPAFLQDQADVFDLRRSFLIDFFRDRAETKRETAETARAEAGAAAPTDRAEQRRAEGRPVFNRAVRELALLRDQQGFEVFAFAYRPTIETDEMLKMSAANEFHTARWEPMVEPYLESHGIADYRKSNLVVSEGDLHPTAPHHRLLARGIVTALEQQGLIERLLKR